MTTQTTEGIPEWTLGDRLRKARSTTGLTTREFAKEIGVSQVTVTNAENDNNKVRKITLMQWALKTGVPIEWLETGTAPTPEGPTPEGGEVVRHQGLEPRTRWYGANRSDLYVLGAAA